MHIVTTPSPVTRVKVTAENIEFASLTNSNLTWTLSMRRDEIRKLPEPQMETDCLVPLQDSLLFLLKDELLQG